MKKYNWFIRKSKKTFIHYEHIRRAGGVFNKNRQGFTIEGKEDDEAIQRLKDFGIRVKRESEYRERPKLEKKQWSPYVD